MYFFGCVRTNDRYKKSKPIECGLRKNNDLLVVAYLVPKLSEYFSLFIILTLEINNIIDEQKKRATSVFENIGSICFAGIGLILKNIFLENEFPRKYLSTE